MSTSPRVATEFVALALSADFEREVKVEVRRAGATARLRSALSATQEGAAR